MKTYTAVITDGGFASYEIERRILAQADAELVVLEHPAREELRRGVAGAHALLVRQSVIDAGVFEVCPECKVVARYGVGVDNVDLEEATARGVVVANTPGFCDEDVAAHAAALLLSLARRVVSHDRRIRGGEWDISPLEPIHRLRGRTVGLLGLGAIGRRLARMLRGFEVKLVAYDPYVEESVARELGAEPVGLEELFRRSDFLSIHAPLTEETHHAVCERTLALMKEGAFLVNTSRGGLVEEGALIGALESGRLAGAALDVFEKEPLPKESPLRGLSNVILSDHAAWYSEESTAELQRRAAEAARDVLLGKRPESVVNPEVYEP